MDFSIIIPAYNEKDRLPVFLKDLVDEIARSGLTGEILLVDDGSTPENRAEYEKIISSLNYSSLKLLSHAKNKGKGAAIQTGFQAAQGRWMGFVDADGATPAKEVLRLIRLALSSETLDGVFGSRILMLGYDIKRLFKRHLAGRIFATLSYFVHHVPVYDSQCGCKFFRRTTFLPLTGLCQEQTWLYDIEILFLAHRAGLKMLEVPIEWHEVEGSKLHFFRDAIKMFFGLMRLSSRFKKNL